MGGSPSAGSPPPAAPGSPAPSQRGTGGTRGRCWTSSLPAGNTLCSALPRAAAHPSQARALQGAEIPLLAWCCQRDPHGYQAEHCSVPQVARHTGWSLSGRRHSMVSEAKGKLGMMFLVLVQGRIRGNMTKYIPEWSSSSASPPAGSPPAQYQDRRELWKQQRGSQAPALASQETNHVLEPSMGSGAQSRADSMAVGPAAQGTAVTGCAHQKKHRWATQQGRPRHPQQCPPQPCTRAPGQHSSSPSCEGGGNRGQGCWKGAQAAAVLQRPCCLNSHPTAGSAPAACPPRGTGTAGAHPCHTESHSSCSHAGAQAAPLDAKDASLLPGLN